MEELNEETNRSRGRKHRMRWIVAGSIGLLLVAAACLFVFYDGPAPDDAALLPRWSERGGKANPLAIFCRELDALALGEAFDQLPESVRKREDGTESASREFLQQHSALFSSFEKLMVSDIGGWQWPEGARVADLYSGGANSIGVVGGSFQLLRLKAHLLSFEGKQEEAALLALQMIRCSRGLQGAEGGPFHMLVSITTERVGQDALKQALSTPATSAALLKRCLKELRLLKALRREDYQFSVRAEYLWFKNATSGMEAEVLRTFANHPQRKDLATAKFYSLLFKRNRTLLKKAELDLPVVEGLDRNWQEARSAAQEADKWLQELHRNRYSPLIYLDGNISGKVLLTLSSHIGLLTDKALIIVTLHDQTEVMLAMRHYELEQGNLPKDLDKLVPTYLDQVPEDPFTGQPLLWDSM
jgi:hypothetical protein